MRLPEACCSVLTMALDAFARGLRPLMLRPADFGSENLPAGQRQQLERQMLDLLMRGMRQILLTSALVGPLLVLWLTWPQLGTLRALGPALLLLAISGERLLLLRRVQREPKWDTRRLGRALVWRSTLSGVVIALWCHFVIAADTGSLVAYVLALVAILSAGAAAQFASWPPVMWAAITPMLLGISLLLLWAGGASNGVGAAFAFFLWLVLSMASLRFARTLHSEALARLHNEELMSELRDKRRQAELANAAKSRFFAAASHDLRQPLQAMALYLGLLRAGHDDAQTLERVQQCMDALDRLLEDLLDLSRLDSGLLVATPQAVALQALLERQADMHQAMARDKGLQLRVRPTQAWARTDPVLLERALSNLLANAIRHTERGGVLLGVRPCGAHWRVCVWDTGVGIAEHDQESVFEEFVQLDNPERNPERGYGLGLPTVRRIAALLGHALHLRSVPGRGSQFCLQLPQAQPDEHSAPAIASAPSDQLTGRVLVVEDNALVRAALVQLLQNWGLQVCEASDARAASAAMHQQAFDVVLSDWRLPGPHDGLAVLRQAQAQLPQLRLGALITGEDLGQLPPALADFVVLRKPLRPLRLRSLLTRHLHGGADG